MTPTPARMLNELAYCPRLYALEHLHGEWADSADTVEGRSVHRRVDKPTTVGLPSPEDTEGRPPPVRSVKLSDDALGIIAVIDLVEVTDAGVVPIDYKKGAAPNIAEGAWEPERVQVCAQALLLRAHGYTCTHGELWFAASKRRVRVVLDDALVARTLSLVHEAQRLQEHGTLPPPLVNSPKCNGCSLVGICLPDETNALRGAATEVRQLTPGRADGLPLYVRLQGGSLGRDHDEIVVREKGAVAGRARIAETSRVVILGNAVITTPLLHALAEADVPVALHTSGGWFSGSFSPASGRSVHTRIAQHRAAADAGRSLELAKSFVRSKIANQRSLLRRNGESVPAETLLRMKELGADVERAPNTASLMGIEGSAARFYFQALPLMLKGELRGQFAFDHRNRRPPKDPVNAMLSFAYACIVRELTVIAHQVGLDAWVGFLHQPRPGRPALALDLMEEFRPVIGDSVVINAVNNRVIGPDDFLVHPTGVALKDGARSRFIEVFERRMDELATHPVFGTRLSYRRILELQARLLGRVLTGELASYPEYRIR